jgi:hypothetical protein
VSTEPAGFATQQNRQRAANQADFRIPQWLCRRLLKIGAVDPRQLAGNVSSAGEASLQRYGPIITKCRNRAEFRGFVLNAPLSSAICR